MDRGTVTWDQVKDIHHMDTDVPTLNQCYPTILECLIMLQDLMDNHGFISEVQLLPVNHNGDQVGMRVTEEIKKGNTAMAVDGPINNISNISISININNSISMLKEMGSVIRTVIIPPCRFEDFRESIQCFYLREREE